MSAPKRIQLRRTKGWRKPEGAIVVARPSKWGNPYTLKLYEDDWAECGMPEIRRMAVSDFSGMLVGKWDGPDEHSPRTYPSIDEIRAELAGHDLACWCPLDQSCHADVLLELANGGES